MHPILFKKKPIGTQFYRRMKYIYEFGSIWIKARVRLQCTQMSNGILFCDKTRVPMFYFDSNTTRPIVPL